MGLQQQARGSTLASNSIPLKAKRAFRGFCWLFRRLEKSWKITLNLFSVFRETDTLWRCGWASDLEKAGAITTCLYAYVNSGTGLLCSCE